MLAVLYKLTALAYTTSVGRACFSPLPRRRAPPHDIPAYPCLPLAWKTLVALYELTTLPEPPRLVVDIIIIICATIQHSVIP